MSDMGTYYTDEEKLEHAEVLIAQQDKRIAELEKQLAAYKEKFGTI